MKNIQKLIFASFIFVHCSQLSAEEDRICNEIRNFASSASKDKPVSITLRTNWADFGKACIHNKQSSEENFCKWLVSNTSMEFMQLNVNRVVSCLIREKSNILDSELDYTNATGEFSVYEVPGIDVDIVLTVSYSFGKEDELPKLTIVAEFES